LALCIGYDSTMQSFPRRDLQPEVRKMHNDPGTIKAVLAELSFDIIHAETTESTGAIIAGNKAFQRLLPNS